MQSGIHDHCGENRRNKLQTNSMVEASKNNIRAGNRRSPLATIVEIEKHPKIDQIQVYPGGGGMREHTLIFRHKLKELSKLYIEIPTRQIRKKVQRSYITISRKL